MSHFVDCVVFHYLHIGNYAYLCAYVNVSVREQRMFTL
jgi:hypothetical protein